MCIRDKYALETIIGERLENTGTATDTVYRNMESGLPAGSVVHADTLGIGDPPDKIGRYWFVGADKDLFRVDTVDLIPYDSSGDGVDDRLSFSRRLLTVRPLPAGEYRIHPNALPDDLLVCETNSDPEGIMRNTVVHVTAPAGTVHEAFFDPVTIGSAVGADSFTGVMSPAGFTVDGTATSISGLKWDAGVVTMGLSPAVSLAGHRAEFIGLDGSAVLTLPLVEAKTQSGSGALTWPAADQPWQDGDLLMLRIAEVDP